MRHSCALPSNAPCYTRKVGQRVPNSAHRCKWKAVVLVAHTIAPMVPPRPHQGCLWRRNDTNYCLHQWGNIRQCSPLRGESSCPGCTYDGLNVPKKAAYGGGVLQ
eukprot:1140196-Pelagomonas_calceolata.AAC.4